MILAQLLNKLPRRAKLYHDNYENGRMWVCEFDGHYEYGKTVMIVTKNMLKYIGRV